VPVHFRLFCVHYLRQYTVVYCHYVIQLCLWLPRLVLDSFFYVLTYKHLVNVGVLAIVYSRREHASFSILSSATLLTKTWCCIHVDRPSRRWFLARLHYCQSLDKLLLHWSALGCCLFTQVSSVNTFVVCSCVRCSASRKGIHLQHRKMTINTGTVISQM